ncbi:mannose-1-phosphate guanylyltransferase [Gallibacterium melopsittaci]|uniref:Mannose-1-phosphate guanylyltransferase n=1 Tax=Gallibacterium melopsittaci TaxID=516063 RepID=A0ABV6HSY6_9PAST
MINLILCGGAGTRLWPLSTTKMPKQFVRLFENKSLFQMNIERNKEHCGHHLIVSNVGQYLLALEQANEIYDRNISYILEPIGRNTAPAIALACFSLKYDDVILVTSSDHLIRDDFEYQKAVEKARGYAEQGFLVTFGLYAKYPEVGFGYIETHDKENVEEFHEKPDFETAKQYIESGNYYWNSGMFCFKAGVFLEELKKYSPDIYSKAYTAFHNMNTNEDNVSFIHENDMKNIPANSIDYAVMEYSKKIKVVCADFGWSDVGSFDSLSTEYIKDNNENASNIEKFIAINSHNNFVFSDKKIVATIDINDLLIINLDDALLISKKGSSQKVKDIVSLLNDK